MKKKLILSLVALATVLSSIAYADTYNYGQRVTGTFSAWYDSSVASYGYTGKLDWARSKWTGVSSNVSIGYSSTNKSSTDEYYVGTSSTPHLYGHTAFYEKFLGVGVPQNPNTTDWDYAVISLYDNNLDADGLKNDTNIKNTATHEVGHSVALDHTTSAANKATSIMTEGSDPLRDRSITAPSTYDKNELKSVWGN